MSGPLEPGFSCKAGNGILPCSTSRSTASSEVVISSACGSTAYAPAALGEARQHHFGQHDTVDTVLLRAGLAVIAAIHRHDEVERGKREQPLAAPPDAAYPMECLRRRTNGDVAHVPVIAVAATTIDRDHGCHY